ncbi:MAG: hypothetical protein MR269_05465 [Clostridiales bacterium]|nr:hypothetical protein [Clostridiales bacterium]
MTRKCKWCGKEFQAKHKSLYCSMDCRNAVNRKRSRDYHRRKYKEAKAISQPEPNKMLNEKIAEANRRGISYGQLQAEKLIKKSRIVL